MRKLGLIATTSLSLGLVACGGDNIDQVREDFESPSGSVSNQDNLIAMETQYDGSTPALGLASGGVPGALTAYGKSRPLAQLSVRQWEGRAQQLFDAIAAARAGNAVSSKPAALVGVGCATAAELNAAYEEIYRELVLDAAFGFGAASGDAEVTVDVGACSAGDLEGSLTTYMRIEVSDDKFEWELKHTMNVCETTGDEACVDGTTELRATAEDMGGSASSAEFIAYWDVQSTWKDEGVTRSGKIRGGVRTLATSSSAGGTAAVEFLFYVQTPDGEEYSYVRSIEVTDVGGMGMVTWTVRGADGELTCTANETEVTCTGDASISYSAAEADALASSWFGA